MREIWQSAGPTPWDEGAYIYRDRDIRNLGYKCVASECLRNAVREIGVEGEGGGNNVYCLCEYHVEDAEEMFWREVADDSDIEEDLYE